MASALPAFAAFAACLLPSKARPTVWPIASAVVDPPPLFPKPWFFGLWCADGWFNKCVISVGNAEKGTVGEKLKLYAASIYMDVHVQQQKTCNCARYTIKYRGTKHPGCNDLHNALVSLKVAHSGSTSNGYVSVSGAKALGFYKHIPDKYFAVSEENMLKLLVGFMDGDGTL